MKTCLFIEGDRFYAHHGVGSDERTAGNYFTIDLRLYTDIHTAAQSDCIDQTVDYAEAHQVISREMNVASQLVEHVAWRIARALFRRFPTLDAIDLRLTKHHPPMEGDVRGAGVEISCRREEMEG